LQTQSDQIVPETKPLNELFNRTNIENKSSRTWTIKHPTQRREEKNREKLPFLFSEIKEGGFDQMRGIGCMTLGKMFVSLTRFPSKKKHDVIYITLNNEETEPQFDRPSFLGRHPRTCPKFFADRRIMFEIKTKYKKLVKEKISKIPAVSNFHLSRSTPKQQRRIRELHQQPIFQIHLSCSNRFGRFHLG
jgi:hypothetical protein